jgi:hypothetical protein
MFKTFEAYNSKRLKFIYSVQRPVSSASIIGLYVISKAAFTIALLGVLLYKLFYLTLLLDFITYAVIAYCTF